MRIQQATAAIGLTVALLFVPVQESGALRPFSWDLDFLPTTLNIPVGMVWVVEQSSGYLTTTGDDYPAIVSVRQDEDLGDGFQSLYIAPTLIAEQTGGFDGQQVVSSLWNYSGQLTSRYQGQVVAERPIGNTGRLTLSLAGYLTPSLGGDFNGDSVIDAADYSVYRDESLFWGQHDYQQWAAGYGTGTVIAESATTIPEPTAAGLALLSILGLASGSRTR